MPSRDVMPKFYRGQLHSGSKSGPVVTSPAQAKAIASSEARAEKANGGRYPDRKKKRRRSLVRRALTP